MRIQAVFFDVGETLVSEARQWGAWADWLRVPRFTFSAALGAVIARGEHHRRVFELLQPGFDLERARRERRALGEPDGFDARDLYPDVAPCFAALRARGYRVGVAGNQPADAERALGALGLDVDVVASSARWGVEKPDRGFFERVALAAGVPAPAVVYVGDRLDNDVLPALDAGMVGVFLRRGPWGHIHATRDEVRRAHVRLDTLAELPDALERLDRERRQMERDTRKAAATFFAKDSE